MTIVTTTYRYKPPPKRKGRKLVRSPGRRPWPRKEAAAQGHCEAGRRRLKFESEGREWDRQTTIKHRPPCERRSHPGQRWSQVGDRAGQRRPGGGADQSRWGDLEGLGRLTGV